MRKEKVIYAYLCKDKLDKEQKKLLTDEMKFENFHSWEQYIINRYKAYSKPSLIEFSKFLNKKLREAKNHNNYMQGIAMAYISGMFTVSFPLLLPDKFENISTLSGTLVPGIIMIIIVIVQSYWFYEQMRSVYFFEDVKDIIDKMIKER